MIFYQGRGDRLLGAALLLTVTCAKAGIIQDVAPSTDYFKHFEVSAAGGVNWYKTPNGKLVISPFETDSDQVKHNSANGSWKVGIGYYLVEDKLQQHYLNQLLFEVNLYQTSTTLSGSVWQYDRQQFNNYNFSAPTRSTRMMFDFKPNLFSWQKISPYAIVGVGATWNTISYTETVTGVGLNPERALSLSKNTTTQVAWDVGTGFRLAITDSLSATAEYIYAFLGHSSPGHGINSTAVPSFSLQSQSLLFGLSLKL